MVDDGREVFRDARLGEPGIACRRIATALQDFRDDGRHEQRHAVGAFVQRADEALVACERRRQAGDIVGDFRLGKRVEHHLLAEPVHAQLAPQRVERMILRHHFRDPERGKPHQARAATPPRDVVDQLDGGAVAPVQVFRHQQQGVLLRVPVEQFTHLPQHALGTDAGQLAAQAVPFFGGAQPRQLQKPGGRDGPQQRRQRRIVAAQVRQCFQHGQVGLARAVMFHALAAGTRGPRETRDEMLDDAGLADTRLARQPEYRALAAARLLPGALQAVDGIPAPDERRRGRLGKPRQAFGIGTRFGRPRSGRRDEPIALAGDGLDEARLARVVAERHAKLADGGLEHRLADELVTPDRVEQRLFRHQGAGLPGQGAQDAERRRGERYRLPAAHQPGVGFVEFEFVEEQAREIRDGRRSGHSGGLPGSDGELSPPRHLERRI